MNEILPRGANHLLMSQNTTCLELIFLANSFVSVERDDVHKFMPGEIGMRELGRSIREDADAGHVMSVVQRLQ
jgi:UPF0288 family protein (methanogenesis marker protein 3)